MRKINIQSNSDLFTDFVQNVDKILAGVEVTDAAGNPTEYADPHFQDRMQRLQQCSFNFEERAMHPISAEIAKGLSMTKSKVRRIKMIYDFVKILFFLLLLIIPFKILLIIFGGLIYTLLF